MNGKTPFELIDGQPINLNLQSHRDMVIQRNKNLEYAIQNGIELSAINVEVSVEVSINCLKCGWGIVSTITDTRVHIDDFKLEKTVQQKPIVCACCETKYRYDYMNSVFTVVLKKHDLKPVRK